MVRKSPARRLKAGPERDLFAAQLKTKYEAGASIRALAKETGRSYAAVHHLLTDARVSFRARGPVRKKSTSTS